MTKKILIMISLMLLSTSMSYALDNPHDYTFPFTCEKCHDMDPESGWWDSSNDVCNSCHKSGGSAIAEKTHSSENTSTKYGTWDQKCIDCHNPHFQKQLRVYKDPSYLYTGVSTSLTTTTFTQAGAGWTVNQWAGSVLVPDTTYYNFQYRIESNTVDTIILKNKNIISTKYIQPNKNFSIIYGKMVREALTSGQKLTVKFFGSDGANSFADGDLTRDGICEVCHTKAVYHKKDGTGFAHNAATKCTTCHEHKFGFEAVCDGCHDNPPGELVVAIRPDLATGSTTSGMHDTHVNTHKMLCEACHYDSVGTGSTHLGETTDKKITMGFNPFNGTNAGGTYDGQAGASYNATTTSPLTTTTNGGNKECSNIYCHGATMAPNGGMDTTPIWDIASTGACNTCHGASTAFPPTKGSHSKHAGTSSAQASLACEVCHKDYTHINTNIEWEFGTEARTAGAIYKGAASGSEVMGSFSYGTCTQLFCHSNASPAVNVASSDPAFSLKNEANDFKTVTWGSITAMECDSCHEGTLAETTSQPVCSDDADFLSKNHTMKSNGHYRLAGPCSGRKYQCRYCHADTMDYVAGKDVITETGKAKHANGIKDVKMSTEWAMVNMPDPSYNPDDMTCDNLYCHSDGTKEGMVGGVTVKPEVRAFPWNIGQTICESCHGHTPGSCTDAGCHDGKLHASDGKFWAYITGWAEDEVWKGAVPMFKNGGPGTDRANSHQRHMEKDFTCDSCHNNTVISSSGNCDDCHSNGKLGDMGQLGHLDTEFHVNKAKDVDFNSGSNPIYHESQEGNWPAKSCENVVCHSSSSSYLTAPIWGGSSFSACIGCHAPAGNDVDDFNWGDDNKDSYCGGTQALLNPDEWRSSGHGRPAVDPMNGDPFGNYPISGNPAADFEAKGTNACSFCHDSEVLHNDPTNPFRLVFQQQFADRFDKECIYCHMQRLPDSSECMDCHVRTNGIYESIAPEATENGVLFKQPNGYWVEQYPEHGYTSNCMGQTPVVAGCHDSDIGTFPLPSTAHKGHSEIPDGQEWTLALQDDVRSQYNMMGVCLKCHEEDSNDECQQCHQGPEYSTGFDPDGEGPLFQFVAPVQAKATSVHYGYKHYLQGTKKGGKFCWDCHDPHGDANIYMIQAKVATKTEGKFGVPVVKMYADGITSLPVVTSTCAADVGGTVVDHRKPVVFTDNAKGADSKTNDPGAYYARTKAWKEATGFPARIYDGICNVCHAIESAGISRHFGSDYGEIGHHTSQKCTQCHEHRFTSSHAGDKACNSCHGNKPVPSHTAFGLPRDCTKCHEGTIYKRMNIMGQMRTNSHHVQGVETTNKHCYACHWEATPDGLINLAILPGTGRIAHEGYNFKTHTSVPDAASDLVLWGTSTTRPAVFALGTTGITFTATSIGTATERNNVSNVTEHCLGCHNTAQNDTQPFSEYGICDNSSYYSKASCTTAGECDNPSYTTEFTCNAAGATWTNFGYEWSADCRTPRHYAWDGTSIGERYSNMGTTTWGKYTTTPKAAQKNIAKAYSAHGNAVANEGGWGAQGLDGAITSTRSGTQNVQCYDCHSSHGSAVAGITSSYVSFSGNKNGGNLKETQDGFGGYTTTYKASKNLLPAAINQYQPGAGQCFDCHETPAVGLKPWGYNSTYGATAAIIGYNDTLSFGDAGTKQSQVRYGFKASRPMVGGHLRAETAMTTAVTGSINGLCTPCHDPHGVSPTLGAGMAYAVPLLKGTWLTSPYQEDTAPDNLTGNDRFKYTSFADFPFDYAVWKPTYWIDQNTFGPGTGIYPGQNGGEGNTWDWNTPTKITENDAQFAGLCLKCHPRANIDPDSTTAWRSMDRIHETVKGWGGQGQNVRNEVHAFTCSKCHQAHVSGLPRLMVTDCLDDKHKGKVPSGGSAANSRLNYTSSRGKGGGTFPYGGFGNEGQPPSYGWGYYNTNHSIGFGGGYNKTLTTCHWPAGGAEDWRLRQRWNNVTQWP